MTAQVSFPLTLVMNLKSQADATEVKKMLASFNAKPEGENPVHNALTKIGTVHFLRFVFLSELQLAVISSYDGDFNTYIKAFTTDLGDIFDVLFSHMCDPPRLPVKDHLAEFIKYVSANDRSEIGGVRQPLYSAYPELSVFTILNLAKQNHDA